MAYNSKAKVKILYLQKILQEETDAEHGLTMKQIIGRLNEYGISAERKSIYSDIQALRDFDIDVRTYRRNPVEYGLARRDFSLGELMLLVDAVQSCRAITDRQAKLLITNIKMLATNSEQEKLDRRIHVVGRIKSVNESVLGAVDAMHDAMRLGCKIEFSYSKLGVRGKRQATHHGKKHQVSPVGVSYDDGFYYLSAWDDAHANMTEYRLDRMGEIRVLKNVPATKNSIIDGYSFEERDAAVFGRFSGNVVLATLEAQIDKLEIITDRFGAAVLSISEADGQARAQVKLCKSEQFFGWVAGMGKAVKIVEPRELVEEYRAYLRSLLEE